MKTIVNKTTKKNNNISKENDLSSFTDEGTFMNIPIDQIGISPLNYRKVYDQQDLENFAQEIAVHGIIQNLTVRKTAIDRYELVAGERRYRAAKIAKLNTVPAMIKVLTDEQVIEIMLAENLQRENPHPLHEAQGIEMMYKTGKSIEAICARLGKSKSFIYSRLKWAELIVVIQEVFLANKLSIQEVTELSFLSGETQQEFFEKYCKEWGKKDFRIIDMKHAISRFKCDLKKAPFDTKDKTLIPDVGACGKCPFNSATIKSLFPEMAKEAVCTNKACYKSKCSVSLQRNVVAAITAFAPDALLTYGSSLAEESRMVIDSIPEANVLTKHSFYDVSIYRMPSEPEKDDYLYEDESEEGEFDEAGFAFAQQDYQADVAEYQSLIDSGKLKKAILVMDRGIELLYFDTERRTTVTVKKVTAKEVQQAIKDGFATPELLTAEISRIQTRELRYKELDREKVQSQVFDLFHVQSDNPQNNIQLTPADLVAARLLVYHSADYHARYAINKALFTETDHPSNEVFYAALANLTDEQYAFLIRSALASRPDSKLPTQLSGLTFYKMAEGAGVDVQAIEKQQQTKAKERESKANARIKVLEGKSNSLFSAA